MSGHSFGLLGLGKPKGKYHFHFHYLFTEEDIWQEIYQSACRRAWLEQLLVVRKAVIVQSSSQTARDQFHSVTASKLGSYSGRVPRRCTTGQSSIHARQRRTALLL